MSVDIDNEFLQDYSGQIALECMKLEKTLSTSFSEYDNSGRLLGKKQWYSVALENNDNDKASDSSNKKNILVQIIDKIVNFIKMVGKKIAAWFQACKTAILKFFGKETIDPKQVTGRFSVLVEGLKPEDSVKLVGMVSQEGKMFLAELLNKEYGNAFYAFYENYKKIKDNCDSVDKFAQNIKFFTDLKESSSELKSIAKDNKVHEKVDESLKMILNDRHVLTNIENMSTVFNEVSSIHENHTEKLQRLLNKIPSENLEAMEGTDVDAKRRLLVNLISDTLKIDSEMVMKINHYMQAIAMLMTYIVKYRYKKVSFISM